MINEFIIEFLDPLPAVTELRKVLKKAMQELQNRRVRVYDTTVGVGHRTVMTTTSKEIHLLLGSMGDEVRALFAAVLVDEFQAKKCSELIVFQNVSREKGIYATIIATSDNEIKIQLAPMN